MKALLQPLSMIYQSLALSKNYLYDNEILNSSLLPVPVFSVGNLTVGGTGKTPFTEFLIRRLSDLGYKVGVVSRSYKASATEAVRVDLSLPKAVEQFGDEPCLLAQKCPQALFFVGPSKRQAAEKLVKNHKVDVVILDDGFQHRKLKRKLDFVLLDATESSSNYNCLPLGRAREPLSSLNRAHALIWTKSNLAEQTPQLPISFPGLKEFFFESKIEKIRPWKSEMLLSPEELPQNLILFSGLARPESFRKLIEISSPGRSIQEQKFSDHHAYSLSDIQHLRQFQTLKKQLFLTTEKDEVKIKNLWPDDLPLAIVEMKMVLKGKNEEFDQFLLRYLR